MLPAVVLLALVGACGGSSGNPARPSEPQPAAGGADTSAPVAIDALRTPSSPASYKGLALVLQDNGAPQVSPVDGVVGFVCIGMSNAAQECDDFVARHRRGEYAGEVSQAVRLVNCAVGSHAIERWNDPAYDATLWDACVGPKLAAARVRADQVRVVWHKAANQFTAGTGGSPLPAYPAAASDYHRFFENLTAFAGRLRQTFPGLQAVYSTSRSYGGFAESAARGEPLSYEEGHALNQWLMRNRDLQGIWFGWGPYIWAPDCSTGQQNGSGVCYQRSDYQADGVHPADGARAKISRMLHARLLREAWYWP